MARTPRSNRPGTVYHHISRLVDRGWFITDSKDRALYVKLLGRAIAMSDWILLAYAVMSNHIHLLTVAGQQRFEDWIRRVHSPFARWMNARNGGLGQKFVRGPTDYAVPPERVARVIAYIHNNPVRAAVVDDPRASSWTSHQAYVGIVPAPPWLDVGEGLRRAGFADVTAFDRFVAANPDDPDLEELLARDFKRGDSEPGAEPAPHWSKRPRVADPLRIVRETANAIGISVDQLTSKQKGPRHVLGRQVAVECAYRAGITGAEIARALNVTQAAASLMLRRSPPLELVEAVLGSDISCTTSEDGAKPDADDHIVVAIP